MLEYHVDTRGQLAKALDEYLMNHHKIAETILLVTAGNQPQDLIVRNMETNTSFVFEFKIGADIHSSLSSRRLEKELQETYLPFNADYKYLFYVKEDAQDYEKDLHHTLSIIDKFFPQIRFKAYVKLEDAIEGVRKLALDPPSLTKLTAPIDYRTQEKNLILSISSLTDGLTPDAVQAMLTHNYCSWGYEIKGWCDLVNIPEEDLQDMLETFFRNYYGRESKALVKKFLADIYQRYMG